MGLHNIGLQRINATTLRISWPQLPDIREMRISWSPSPESDAVPQGSTRIRDATRADIPTLQPNTRYYFTLRGNGQILGRAAERLVPFEGTFNFRDLGGYATENGRRIKWGRIFRSDSLNKLTPGDQQLLQQMQITQVCDFRSQSEKAKSPNALPQNTGIAYLHLPMVLGSIDAVEAMEKIKKQDLDWLTPEYMTDGYLKLLEDAADKWGEVFKGLLEQESCLVFHCSAGKDRTGICAALILMVLGVPRETVIADHALSNEYLKTFLSKINSYFASQGVDTRRLQPYLTAPEEAIIAVLNHLQTYYGSIEKYLTQKTEIRPDQIQALKNRYLE